MKARFPRARIRIYYGSTEVGTANALCDADDVVELYRVPSHLNETLRVVDALLQRSEPGFGANTLGL